MASIDSSANQSTQGLGPIEIQPEKPDHYRVEGGKLYIGDKPCVVKQDGKVITDENKLIQIKDVFNQTLKDTAKIGKKEVWKLNPEGVQVLKRQLITGKMVASRKNVHAEQDSMVKEHFTGLMKNFTSTAEGTNRASARILLQGSPPVATSNEPTEAPPIDLAEGPPQQPLAEPPASVPIPDEEPRIKHTWEPATTSDKGAKAPSRLQLGAHRPENPERVEDKELQERLASMDRTLEDLQGITVQVDGQSDESDETFSSDVPAQRTSRDNFDILDELLEGLVSPTPKDTYDALVKKASTFIPIPKGLGDAIAFTKEALGRASDEQKEGVYKAAIKNLTEAFEKAKPQIALEDAKNSFAAKLDLAKSQLGNERSRVGSAKNEEKTRLLQEAIEQSEGLKTKSKELEQNGDYAKARNVLEQSIALLQKYI